MLHSLRSSANRLWYRYNRALVTRPLPVKVATSTVGLALGDIIAQLPSLWKGERWDIVRTVRFSSFGLLIHGPLSHVWYQFLDKRIMATAPKSFRAVVAKTCMDQLLWAPIFTSVFFAYLKAAQGKWGEIVPEIQHKLWPTLQVNWLVWPAAHIFNFRFVPDNQRVLYINVIALGYNAFLSSMAAARKVPEPLQQLVANQPETQ